MGKLCGREEKKSPPRFGGGEGVGALQVFAIQELGFRIVPVDSFLLPGSFQGRNSHGYQGKGDCQAASDQDDDRPVQGFQPGWLRGGGSL